MIPDIIFMLIAVFVAYYISATFGFGDALILLPILTFFIDIEVGIIFTGFWAFPQAIQQVIKYRQYVDKNFLLYFLPTVIPGIFLGIWLLVIVSSVWIQIILGFFILAYVSYNFYKKWKNIEEEDLRYLSKPSLLIGGFAYGTISSWVGAPGPISIIYLEYSGHYRESFIANNTAIVVLAGIFKLSLYLINGLFPLEYIWLFIGGLLLCLIATKLGHYTTPKIPVEKFQGIINIILLIVGIRMIVSGILDFN
jgi:hypothetical protein